MDIAKKVKHLLLEKNVTATKLAQKVGITQPAISYKMTNNSYSIEDLEKIAKALDCELEINFVLNSGEKI
mgnify:FL=1